MLRKFNKAFFIKTLILVFIIMLTLPQVRVIIESYYIKYFTIVKIEDTIPSSLPLKISYFAKEQIGITTSYDGSYKTISYPNGDIDISTGVCTDVIIRALRKVNIDLQQLIHEDMILDFKSYPNYGLLKPDYNIDHRRVLNIKTYFKKQGYSLTITKNESNYKPGDIVTWKSLGRDHIGIVSNIKVKWSNRYHIVHNAYKGTELSDWLNMGKVTGHYRVYN